MQATVLVVDDDPLVRWSMRAALAPRGFRVLSAGTGAEAVRLAGKEPVDVVLLDWSLPDGDGLAVVPALVRTSPGCRVLLLTAYASDEMAVRAEAVGARILAKPFEVDEVLRRVEVEVRSSIRMQE